MDFIKGLPNAKGKTMILVVADRFSKYGYFIGLSHPFKAFSVAQLFLDNIYKLHGAPSSIVFDKDKVFLNSFLARSFQTIKN